MASTAIAGQQMEIMAAAARKPRGHAQSVAERNRELFEAQRRARRGPTPEVFFAKHLDNTRLVKDAFREGARNGVYEVLTKKPVVAGEEEERRNPRARSAKMRAAEKQGRGKREEGRGKRKQ